ncbi:MAG TPA: class I SAM-dependent methyltransferase [Candidatus Sulfotelmatobacter sp.]|nr:class I SAM-dependent methyltransferase [Candidatus Sulfotelmatobacter sp.]
MESEVLHQCNLCDSAYLDVLDATCNIARCRACGYVFDNPRPTLQALIDFYSKPGKYDSWLEELEARERLWQRRLNKLRSTRKTGSLLDAGAGIGQFLSLARGEYSEVYGTEVSTTAVNIAKEKYGLELFHGVIDDLVPKCRTFDNITLFHVLEHVPDPKSMLKTCRSLLASGGVLVIAVPNEVSSLRGMKRRLFSELRHRKDCGMLGLPRLTLDGSISEIHLSHFSPPVLARLLEATGFKVVAGTLDPYYVRTGLRRIKADFYYYGCLLFHALFRINIYDTILMVARKA